jgi:hypothetical protein
VGAGCFSSCGCHDMRQNIYKGLVLQTSELLEPEIKIMSVEFFMCRITNNNNNSIKFFIIYVPSQQPQGQLQTQHSVAISNCIMDKHNIKIKTD